MTDEESLFAEALAKGSTDERGGFLDAACAGNPELRARVEALLSAHAQARGILETPPPGLDETIKTIPPRGPIGSTIGPYKLLEQIGGGGMGVVYMAEQLRPVRRKVALKIIKPGMDSSQVIARFEAERQALTMMDHPNIARVLDAGTTDAGRPYFVMELVKGVPITDYCDQATLTMRQRLELFIDVCRAVQHAHQKGIIHRDLKPTNVLVTLHDDKPVPKVIDFGIAKATGQQLTERTLFTNYAQMLGTPLYMSPEQAQISGLDVDTRSDVYSLGVLLYELLTGTTPFDKQRLREAAYDEMRRIIREEDPPHPSTRLSTMGERIASISAQRHTEPKKLGQLVRGELDWIVMKTLEKDRTRRYETANGLASDVQRYLSDEPVHACPPSTRYRLGKLVRRHRLELGVAAGFILLLVAATVVSSWQALRARRAEVLTQSLLETEKEARAQAVTEATKATTISDLLQEMLTSANPDQTKGVDYSVRQMLDDSSLRLGDQLKGQPEVEAAVRAAIGNAYRRLVMTDKAEPHLARALALRRALAAKAGKKSNAEDLVAQSLLDYGWNVYMSGRPADAERYLRESVGIYKANGVRSIRLIEALSTLQLSVDNQLRFRDAEAVANETLALGRELFPEGHGEIANVLHRLGGMKQAEGDLRAAEPLIRKAVDMHRRWHGNDHPETAWSLLVLGDLLFRQAKYSEAEASCREALASFSKQYGSSHPVVLNALEKLERVLVANGDQAALASFRADKAARLSKSLARETDVLKIRMELATILRDSGNLDAALTNFSEAAEIATAAAPDVKLKLADACAQLARLLRDKQRPEQAAAMYRHAFSLREPIASAPPAQRLDHANDLNDAGFVLLLLKRSADAEGSVRAAAELKRALVNEFPDTLDYRIHLAHSQLGLSYIARGSGRTADAEQAAAEATRLLNTPAAEAPEASRAFRGHTLWKLADEWLRLKNIDEAEHANQSALKAFAQLSAESPANPYYRQEQGFTHRKLGDVAQRAGRMNDAERHLRDSVSFYGKLVAADPDAPFLRQELAVTAQALAELYCQSGQWNKAADELTAAAKLATDQPGILAPLALLYLATQDEPAYRRTCAALVEQSLPHDPQGDAACNIALACVLLPDVVADANRVVKIAERAVAANPIDPDYLIALGAALYRAGRFEDAVKTLADAEGAYRREQATPTPGIYVVTSISYSHLFLTMAHHRLGHDEEAAHWRKHALQALDALPTTRPSNDHAWKRRLTLQILGKEAELTAPRE